MKTLVVDDHELIRDAMHGVLRELLADLVVIEAPDSATAIRSLEEHPDLELVLLDLYLPDRDGFDLLAELRDRFPAVGVVVLSASEGREDISRALDLGALGFIPKSAPREVMVGALRLVLAGGIYVPPEIVGAQRRLPAVPPPQGRPTAAALGLTERQLEVLRLVMQGRSNKAICRTLGLAEATVKNHVTAIFRALNVRNRTEAAIAASALGVGRRRDDREDGG